MSVSVEVALRILEACKAKSEEPLISFVVEQRGGRFSQIFLRWERGKCLKDYIRDKSLTGLLGLYQATQSLPVNQEGMKCRLYYIPSEGDELTFRRPRTMR